MTPEALAVFRALSGKQILAMDRDALLSAIVMADRKGKVYADAFPDDEERTEKPTDAGNGVRVIPIKGIVSHGFDKFTRFYFGMTETDNIAQWTRNAVADPAVKAIVFDISSPGGYVTGTAETASVMAEATVAKPTIAHTSTLMASAAFWMGASAALVYATPSATVGSIGVFTTHLDVSEYMERMGVSLEVFKSGDQKAAGIGGTALTDAQKAVLQADIDSIGAEFREWVVARRRAVVPEAMDGRAVSAKASIRAGMGLVDSLADLSTAIRDAAALGRRADKSPNH
jgi:signal peptide peptidase SppA